MDQIRSAYSNPMVSSVKAVFDGLVDRAVLRAVENQEDTDRLKKALKSDEGFLSVQDTCKYDLGYDIFMLSEFGGAEGIKAVDKFLAKQDDNCLTRFIGGTLGVRRSKHLAGTEVTKIIDRVEEKKAEIVGQKWNISR